MDTREIDLFFETLSKELGASARIILIGGAASLIMGGNRPTRDVDFEISTNASPSRIEQGIKASESRSGLASEYSDNIERWSVLDMPGYRKQIKKYKKFGKLTVYLLRPEYWSIGKMGRYLDSDIQDLVTVFSKQQTKPTKLAKVWKRVLSKSPISNELFHFKKHIQHFVSTYGKGLWGKKFNAQAFLATNRLF